MPFGWLIKQKLKFNVKINQLKVRIFDNFFSLINIFNSIHFAFVF